MKKKIIAALLTTILIMGIMPVGVSAEWKQNSDNSWSWIENDYFKYYDGFKEIDGKWYYFKSGNMQTGWIQRDGYTGWYYLGDDGAMKTGWINKGGISYYLKDDGLLATDTVIDGFYFNSKGIVQPKEKQKVLVDNKYVKITYLGADKVGDLSKKAEIQIENKSNQDLLIETENDTIDGFEPQFGGLYENISSGKTFITSIKYYNSVIKTNFDNIEGDFLIRSNKDLKILEKESFKLNLK